MEYNPATHGRDGMGETTFNPISNGFATRDNGVIKKGRKACLVREQAEKLKRGVFAWFVTLL